MGNQISSNTDKKTQNVNAKTDEGGGYYKENNSSYKGMKTDSTDNPNTNNGTKSETQSTIVTNELKDPQDLKVPTQFEWKEGGKIVYVTGNFSNWSQWFMMSKNITNNYFELTLELPRGNHQYKFIVDNVWKFSKHFPTCSDGKGNINNIIDTNLLISPVKRLETPLEARRSITIDEYNEYIPKKSELNTDAPIVPLHYSKSYFIDNNTTQMNIGMPEFLIFNDRNNFSENNSFKNVTNPPHINL